MVDLALAGIGYCSVAGRRNPDGPNQDSYGLPGVPRPGTKGLLFCVADGLGTRALEETGSQVAVRRIQQQFERDRARDSCGALQHAFEIANREVFKRSGSELFNDLSASVVCAVVSRGDMTVAHAGEARAYLVMSQQIQRLTEDHVTFVTPIDEDGEEEQQAQPAQFKSLRRSVGSMPTLEVNCKTLALQPDARILLCTPGLSNVVGDDELREIVSGCTPADSARRLVDLATERASTEDITAVVIEPRELFLNAVPEPAWSGASRLPQFLVAGLAAVLVAAVLVALGGGDVFGLTSKPAAAMTTIVPVASSPTVLPMVGGVAANVSVTPTPTSTDTPTIVPSATPTPTESQTPTPADLPTDTPTPEPAPTDTPQPPQATAVPRPPAPRPTPTIQLRYSAVRLREPQNDQQVTGLSATFEFETQRLASGDSYGLYYRRPGSANWSARCSPISNGSCVLSPNSTQRNGTYEWMVVIMDSNGIVVSKPSEVRRIRWTESLETGGPPQPGCIPQPPNRC